MTTEAHDEIAKRRAQSAQAIVDSKASKKLIVAGPGTGKTFTFRRALDACNGRGLAVTFIRNLVLDLRQELGDIADVFTFHGFCKHQLHRHPTDGLGADWHYYPPLLDLVAADLQLLGNGWDKNAIERALHTLDRASSILAETLRLGSYYNAVSHTDVVYRVLRHFEDRADEVPSYPLIVVDEYQDFSELETRFIQHLATRSDVLIAGDDDQALYTFKNAEARFIRELAASAEFERFPLPYCSRCTDVVVRAVNDVLEAAIKNGNLKGRLDKDFQCFVPDKAADSAAHPKIIHAICSVQSKKVPYVGKYIVQQIKGISLEEIEESHAKGYPTVLVVGPNPFLDAAFQEISKESPQAVRRKSSQVEIDPLDAYRYLARDERSRLGWRILIACSPCENSDDVLTRMAQDEAELVELIPEDYRAYHLALVRLVGRLLASEELEDQEAGQLVEILERPFDQIREDLMLAEGNEEADEAPSGVEEPRDASIICTSLIGSKGLSAGHVFIVGFNNGHLPRDPAHIEDEEVCQFLVGLSRTRKACHVISVRHYGHDWLSESRFAQWIDPEIETIQVDKAYFEGQT